MKETSENAQIRKKSGQMDMLHGSLWDKILLFALPLAASSILQQLFNSADVAVAGRFAGNEALAAVGGNSSVISLMINLFVGLSVGANVVIANYIGQQKPQKVKESVHTVCSIALISGVILLLLGMFTARPLLQLMNTPTAVLDLAVVYLKIYFCGMPFVMVYNFGSAILRSVGDTKKPLYCLIISGILNVCLNLMFVICFQLSVVGVALATVISNGISAGLIVYFLTHADPLIRLNLRELTLHKEQVIKVVRIGAPAGLQGMVFSISNVCIQAAINGFGTNAIAGSAAALNYEYFTYFVTSAFSQAAVTFTSQNFGAGQKKRCKQVFYTSLLFGIIITGIMSIIFVMGRGFFNGIYTTEPEAIDYAVRRMMRVQILECLPCLYEIGGSILRGMGYSMLPAIITVFGSCGLRVLWLYTVFRWVPTYEMLMNVYPVTWIITSMMMLLAYWLIARKALKQ